MRRFLLIAAALLLAGAGVQAQDAPASGAPREEILKMVDAYVISNLQESLGLTDEQFVRLLPLVKKAQGDRRGFIERRLVTLAEIRRLLESGLATEARIGDLMRDLKSQENEQQDALRRDRDAIDAQLGVVQQAKLRLLEARVEQRLRELATRARGPGGRFRGDAP